AARSRGARARRPTWTAPCAGAISRPPSRTCRRSSVRPAGPVQAPRVPRRDGTHRTTPEERRARTMAQSEMTVVELREWMRGWVCRATGLDISKVTDDRSLEDY